MTYTIIGGDNKEYGPISAEDMRLWISEGRLNAQTRVKSEADMAWRTLGSFPEFADLLSPQHPPAIGALSSGAAPAASAAATAPLNTEGDYELDIGGCVSRGWNLYKENFGFLFLTFLIVFALTIVTSMALGSILAIFIPKNLMMQSEAARQFQHLVVSVGLALVAGPLSGGMYRAFLKKSRQEPVDFGEVFSGFSNFAPLFLGYLLIALISTLCMLPYNFVTDSKIMPILEKFQSQPSPQEMQDLFSQLISAFMSGLPVLLICLVPATYLLVSLQFTLPLIADKQMSVGQAMKTSWVMVNKHWFQVFGLTVVLGLITVAGALGCCVGVIFTIPISIAGLMAAYESIFGAARKTSRAGARNAALMNLLGTPGLGSLMARRWIAGTGQLALFLTGFIFFCAWVLPTIKDYYSLPFSDTPPPPVPGGQRAGIGIVLCVVSWCWSLITSVSLMRRAGDDRVEALKTFAASAVIMDEAQIVTAMGTLPQWLRQDGLISRTYEFKDFPAAMAFVNEIARLSEQAKHHPDVDIRWNKVTLALTTHDAGGLTAKDFAMARQCDLLSVRD